MGSDAHMMIDLFEEARVIELDERLGSGRRGQLPVTELPAAVTANRSHSLGWDAGRIEAGALADLTTVRLDSPRTAGARVGDPLGQVVFAATAATAADVPAAVGGGRVVVAAGCHRSSQRPRAGLEQAIGRALAPSG